MSKKRQFFSCKTSVFAGLGGLFGTFFWHFFVIFSCRNSVFCEAGRSFLVRKRHFFRAKLQFLRGWVVFLSRKNGIFLRFFRKCRRRPSVGEPGGPKRAKRARANSRRESRVGEAGGHQPVWVRDSLTLRCRPPTPMIVK